MQSHPLRLALQLGLFQLSLGILGVLILGLLNRLLIQDIQLPAVLAALAVGGQQLMGFTRAWFGHRSDRIPPSRLRRTPFIVISSLAIALLFGVVCQLVLRLATSMEASGGELNGLLIGLLILVFVAIGTAIAAGGTAFSALIADRTTAAERPRVLSVVWGMRLMGVLLGSVLVNQVFGSACAADASRTAVLAGLQRLSVVTPLVLLGLGVASVFGVERRITGLMAPVGSPPPDVPQRLALPQLLLKLRSIPQAGRFLGVLCLFTFSMFLNDAVLEPYGAAVFGMSVCATTSLNVLIALGFFGGLGLSGFWLIERVGNICTARVGAVLAAFALMLMLLAGAEQSIPLLRAGVALFGLSLGVCMNACLTLMFSFVQPGRTGFLLGIWGAGYAYSCGLATISGGGLLTLFQALNGGDLFASYGGVFALQMVCFLGAALMTRRLDVVGFRNTVKTRFSDVMEMAVD
ncbi:BCD family MFS transporter [Synechococcus sp. HB1133]|uniref:MFS transporter n=1 Tax=unclassified Synechococcus TaxID=2626047 RepID=UPI001407A7D0|nr:MULTISPECIES: MFS transporter [unclassified Synechococcus]MCB4393513.1 BCD family MFS transporter [Synechococcus sp. PH41509]MCB4422310.1 BCD family MFS transporter [Synechococcus sp. HB1133]MCB4429745.1 BCD family MFS transporter [Synechococcus sp. HBA1120]NHI81253.1 light-harvesting protein [Synechococcus sp. HB1133]